MNFVTPPRIIGCSTASMTPRQEAEKLAAKQHGVLTRDQATGAGLTEKMIRTLIGRGDWKRVLPSVYRLGHVSVTYKSRLMAAVLWAGPYAAASGPSAGRLFGLLSSDVIEVTTNRKLKARDGIRLRYDPSFETARLAVFDGIPVTRIGRTVFDLCGSLTYELASNLVADALRGRLIDLPRLGVALDEFAQRGAAGSKNLRRILTERFAHGVTDSHAEDIFKQVARRRGFRFTFHYAVRSGGFVAELDFSLPHIKLDIEIDGYRDHGDPVASQHDKNRDAELARMGWAVLRFTYWDLIQRPDWVFECIAGAISERSPEQLSVLGAR